jgi:hypothetical protein
MLRFLPPIVLVLSLGQAIAACPDAPDADTLEIDGIGVIHASSIAADDAGQFLRNACFEYQGWTFSGPAFRATGGGLEGKNVSLEASGGKGTVATFAFQALQGSVAFQALRLDLTPGFQLQGFPFVGRYSLAAETGSLNAARFELNNASFDEFSESGQPTRRIQAKRAILNDYTATLFGAVIAQMTFSIRGAVIVQANQQIGVLRGDAILGRNRDADEIAVQADRSTIDEEGIIHLENATPRVFGVRLFALPSLEYDPNEPFPFVFLPGSGTFGLTNFRIGKKRDGVRVGVVVHDLFTGPVALSFGVSWTQPNWKIALFQAKNDDGDDTVQANVLGSLGHGFGYSLILNSGRNLLGFNQPRGERGFEWLRGNYTLEQTGSENILEVPHNYKVRGVLEVGQVWQEISDKPNLNFPHTLSQFVGYAATSLGAGFDASAAGFTWEARGSLNAYEFTPSLSNDARADPTFTSGLGFDAGLKYVTDWFSTGVSFGFRQPLENTYARTYTSTYTSTGSLTLPFIRRFGLEEYTRAGFFVRLNPSIAAPEAGYAGLGLENPAIGLTLEVNARKFDSINEICRVCRITGSFDLNVYDGQPFMDTFGRTLALPVFTLTPFARYDFAFLPGVQIGQFGTNLTVYTGSLGFTLAVTYETQRNLNDITSGAWKFGFSAKIR